MTDKPIRVGVVGRGFGRYGLVPAFRRDPRCLVAAICTTEIGSARATADGLSIPSAYGSWADMLRDEQLEAIAVAAPPEVQPDILAAAMESGVAVFAEKPLATTVEQAERLVRVARESGLANVVDFIFPELDTWGRALGLIRSGQIGEIELVTVDWTLESYDIARNADTWKTGLRTGGGALSHFGSHVCHYLEQFVGPIGSVSARLTKPDRVAGEGDTTAAVIFEFESGTVGTVTLSTSSPFSVGHRVTFHGENGAIILSNPTSNPVAGFKLFSKDDRGASLREILVEDVAPTTAELDDRVPAVARLVSRFNDWANGGDPVSPRFEHGLRAQRIVEACRQSDATGRKIDIGGGE